MNLLRSKGRNETPLNVSNLQPPIPQHAENSIRREKDTSMAHAPCFVKRGSSWCPSEGGTSDQDFIAGLEKNHVIAAIPCYNESLTIGSIVLKSSDYVHEILVVDDGSSDDTRIVAERAGATVIRHEKNLGYGGAIRTCFEYARGTHCSAMVILDGDGQHDPADIPQFLSELEKKGVDVVIGSRFIDNPHSIPLYRRFGIKVLDIVTGLNGGVKTTDSQSGFRAYARNAICSIDITETAMGAGSQILMLMGKNGLKWSEIPIHVRYDIRETSTKNPLLHGAEVIFSIISYRFLNQSFLFVMFAAIIMVVLGILIASDIFIFNYGKPDFSFLYAIVTSVIFIFASACLFMKNTFDISDKNRKS